MKLAGKIRIFLISLFVLCSFSVFGQCDSDSMLDECAHNLGTFNYIKSYVIKASSHRKSHPGYSYVFSKGSTYLLIACEENLKGGRMIINLYDREHNLIASTYNEKENKYFPELRYSCETTGLYYIKATFEGSKGGCGMCILGFDKE